MLKLNIFKLIGRKMKSTLEEYLENLEKRYRAHYNVERNKEVAGKELDIYAISVIEHFRHVFTKKSRLTIIRKEK